MRRRSLLLLLLAALLPAIPAYAAPRCFPEAPGISDCIDGRIAAFWQGQGGLPVFGYPIGAESSQTVEGRTFQAQVFERNRLELHPELASPYDVLLGRLGAEALERQGRDWRSFPKADPAAPHYFAETGHAIAPQFWAYWSSHGLEFDGRPGASAQESLALFGLPLSEPAMETNSSGDTVLTQWFERARFELHPENQPPYTVLLGLLSRELSGGSQAQPSALAPGGFIQVSGDQLTRQGQPVLIKGVNYYPQWRPWSPMWRDWDGPQVERELRLARDQLGINAVRVMVPFNFTGKPGGDGKVTPLLVGRLREMAQIAGSLDMRLIVTLFDFYKSFANPGGDDEQRDYAYLHELIGNFAGDDRILAWDVHNEPDNYDRWKDGDQQRILGWLGRMADYIHKIDPNHLVTVGMSNQENLWLPGPDGRRVIDYSDIVSIHIYDAGAASRIIEWIRAHTDRPILIEEFGWPTGPTCMRNYDEATQAFLYRNVLDAARAQGTGVVAWTLRDYDAGPTDRWDSFEEHFGLFRADNSLKPAAELLRAYAAAPLPSAHQTSDPLTSTNPQLPGGNGGPLRIPGTSYYVKSYFRKAWDMFGGQRSFGLPLTDAYVRPEDRRVVQYFEGGLLELHLELVDDSEVKNLPDKQRYERLIEPLPIGTIFAGSRFSGEHPVSATFQGFYNDINGGWRLGTAISDELVEQIDGAATTVQYFQKGRLERGADGAIKVGKLGSWALEAQCGGMQP